MGGTKRCSSIGYSYDRFGLLYSVGKPALLRYHHYVAWSLRCLILVDSFTLLESQCYYSIVTIWYGHCGIAILVYTYLSLTTDRICVQAG